MRLWRRRSVVLRPEDLKIDTYRAGTSVVRITHLPSGCVGTSDEQTSQFKARAEALNRLTEEVRRSGWR